MSDKKEEGFVFPESFLERDKIYNDKKTEILKKHLKFIQFEQSDKTFINVCNALEEYAKLCVKASLDKAAENATAIEGSVNLDVDKSSITDEENIVLI